MYLKKLSVINFKNYTQCNFSFSNKVNCITGANGIGKTNLLDAIYYLSFCKSFFNPSDSQNTFHGESFFVLQGSFLRLQKDEDIYVGFKKTQKKQVKRNGKAYPKFTEHIGLFPTIMVSPFDSRLIHSGSDERRKFMDIVISSADNLYLQNLIKYNKALSQRNALLKDFATRKYFDARMLELWNEQLVGFGQSLYKSRVRFIEELMPVFQMNYEHISQGNEKVNITYESQLSKQEYAELLNENIEKDRALQYTTTGIHRDDLSFKIGTYSLRRTASQGQQKTFVMALRFAQFEFIKKSSGFNPILLLDDIFDKLDEKRVKQIIELIAGANFGQIFITDTNRERVNMHLNSLNVEFEDIQIQ